MLLHRALQPLGQLTALATQPSTNCKKPGHTTCSHIGLLPGVDGTFMRNSTPPWGTRLLMNTAAISMRWLAAVRAA